jgi:predicted AAA+ superfamily ATPase
MLTKEELRFLVLKNQQEIRKNLGMERDKEIKLRPKFASIISGVRRCGKSTIGRQIVKKEKIVYYMHFEDVAFGDFTAKDFTRLDQTFEETLGNKGIYFFDEIQNIKGWEVYVRQLVDSGNKVLITGSNATMMSRELGTRLTGRNIRYELYPFSYREFLKFKKFKPSVESFKNYLKYGGFPEYLKTEDIEILRNLFQDIFYRDIVVRNDIKNESDLKSLLSYISSNIGKKFSYNKIGKALGIKSTHTVTQFVNACEDAFLFFPVKIFNYSVKKQLANPKKIYCIDTALIRMNSFSASPDYGRLLENHVFLDLKRRKKETYYYNKKNECDFVIKEKNKITEAIQVCYYLESENKDREINGLLDAMEEYNLKKGTILTLNQQDELEIQGKKIEIIPAWKWLMKKH